MQPVRRDGASSGAAPSRRGGSAPDDQRGRDRRRRARRPPVAGGGRPARRSSPITRRPAGPDRRRTPTRSRPTTSSAGSPPAQWSAAAGRADVAADAGLLGVDEPDFGVLLDDMFVDEGDEIRLETVAPAPGRGQMAFVMATDLAGPGVTVADALTAIAGVLPAIEIVDSRIADWRITLADTVADNASCGRVVLGGRSPPSTARRPAADRGAALPQRGRRSRAVPGPRPSATPPAAWRGWRTSSARSAAGCAAATSCCRGPLHRMVPVRPGDSSRPSSRTSARSPCGSAEGRPHDRPRSHRRRPDRGRARRARPSPRSPASCPSSTSRRPTRPRPCSSSTGCRPAST